MLLGALCCSWILMPADRKRRQTAVRGSHRHLTTREAARRIAVARDSGGNYCGTLRTWAVERHKLLQHFQVRWYWTS